MFLALNECIFIVFSKNPMLKYTFIVGQKSLIYFCCITNVNKFEWVHFWLDLDFLFE